MSMTTEQIKRLKDEADLVECTHDYTAKLLREAADTIKVQSAKIHAYAMERSTAYYNGGWISVKERLPEEYGEYLITWTTSQTKRPLIAICEYEITSEYDYKYSRFKGEWLLDDYIKNYPNVNVIAWMPLPEPAKLEDETE